MKFCLCPCSSGSFVGLGLMFDVFKLHSVELGLTFNPKANLVGSHIWVYGAKHNFHWTMDQMKGKSRRQRVIKSLTTIPQ